MANYVNYFKAINDLGTIRKKISVVPLLDYTTHA